MELCRRRWPRPGDRATGQCRQRWKGGFATKREAELALHRVLGQVDAGEVADAGALTVGAFLEQRLVELRPSLKPTTAKGYGDASSSGMYSGVSGQSGCQS